MSYSNGQRAAVGLVTAKHVFVTGDLQCGGDVHARALGRADRAVVVRVRHRGGREVVAGEGTATVCGVPSSLGSISVSSVWQSVGATVAIDSGCRCRSLRWLRQCRCRIARNRW